MLKELLVVAFLGVASASSIQNDNLRFANVVDTTNYMKPYQAVILDKNLKVQCGAVIVAKKHLLTSITCKMHNNKTSARVGSSFSHDGGQLIRLKEIIPNPDVYVGISVVVLKKKIEFIPGVQIIRMVSQNGKNPPKETLVNFSGFELKEYTLPYTGLQEINLPIGKPEFCWRNGQINTAIQQCVAEADNVVSCRAGFNKNGNPMVYNNTLYGITSAFWTCENGQYIGLIYKLSVLRNWVDETIKNNN